MATIDRKGSLVKIYPDGLVKLDGVAIFRKVNRDGILYLQFIDHDRMRIQCRGSKYVEIPVAVLVDKVEGKDNADEQTTASPNDQQGGN